MSSAGNTRLGTSADRAPARAPGCRPRPVSLGIYRCLKRHGLIELRRRRKRRDEFRRWERERPMQLWQMDVMGGVLLEDDTELKIVTGVDDHSRFCIAAGLVTRATSKAVCAVSQRRFVAYGIPDEILTDNGKVFTGRFGTPAHRGPVRSHLPRERDLPSPHRGALTDDHRQDRTVPPEPAQGVPRRPDLRLDRGPRPSSTPGCRLQHRAAAPGTRDGDARRALRPGPSTRIATSVPVDCRGGPGGQWVLRRVGSNGFVSVDNQIFSVTNAFKGQLIDVFVDDTVIQVWSKNHLIQTVARLRKGPVRKIRADGLHVQPKADLEGKRSAGP